MGGSGYNGEGEDPDNWFRIPEFGVQPAEVDWAGFSVEIVYVGCNQIQLRADVRELLATARRLAIKEGASIRAFAAALSSGARDMTPHRPTMRCLWITRDLEQAVEMRDADGRDLGLEEACESLARASVLLASWLEERASNSARKGAFVRHAENRAMKQQVFEWCDAHRSKYRTLEDCAAAVDEARLMPAARRTIRTWMTEWNKKRSARRP